MELVLDYLINYKKGKIEKNMSKISLMQLIRGCGIVINNSTIAEKKADDYSDKIWNKLLKQYSDFYKKFQSKSYKSYDKRAAMSDRAITKVSNDFKNYNGEISDMAVSALFYGKELTRDSIRKLEKYVDDLHGKKANKLYTALKKMYDSAVKNSNVYGNWD